PGAPTPEPYTLSLHDALPILVELDAAVVADADLLAAVEQGGAEVLGEATDADGGRAAGDALRGQTGQARDRLGDRQVGQLADVRSEEHTSELQSRENLVCRLL